jgi:hypothetical protein
MYTVTMNELKVVLNMSVQAGQSGAVNKTSVHSTPQNDDSLEVKRRKGHSSNDTSQTDKKSTKLVPTSTAVNLPPKAVLTRKFFASLRTNHMDMQTTGARNTLPEQEAHKKSGRSPPIMLTSTTKLIRIQRDLKEHVKGEYEFRNT